MYASKVIDLRQINYTTIEVNEKIIKAGSKNQYLIDDIIPKVSNYSIKKYFGELPYESDYIVNIKDKFDNTIVIVDNSYIIINHVKYKIISGHINWSGIYSYID